MTRWTQRRRAGLRSSPRPPPLESGFQGQLRHRPLEAAVFRLQLLQAPGQFVAEAAVLGTPGCKVCSETPTRGLASPTVLPAAITTSASLSLLMISCGVRFLFAISSPFFIQNTNIHTGPVFRGQVTAILDSGTSSASWCFWCYLDRKSRRVLQIPASRQARGLAVLIMTPVTPP